MCIHKLLTLNSICLTFVLFNPYFYGFDTLAFFSIFFGLAFDILPVIRIYFAFTGQRNIK